MIPIPNAVAAHPPARTGGSATTDPRPGLNSTRLVRLMRESVERCRLDLSGAVVFTEAASGPYAVTPVLAALAGAERVCALTRSSPYGTVEEIAEQTESLAQQADVGGRIAVVTEKRSDLIGRADIVTNSGHVRPLDAETIGWMKPTAVVPLMYEAWELRPGEVDLEACHRRGVRVAGTNERHPNVDVFSYLGVMAVKLLLDAGVAVYRGSVLVVCDNPFAPFIRQGLASAGAEAEVATQLAEATMSRVDAVVVATKPRPTLVIGREEAGLIAARWPGAVVAQYWGDVDRTALAGRGIPCWPAKAPAPGHMGVLPSAVGPEPVVRLQTGGLKVAEVLLKGEASEADWGYVDAV